MTSRRDRRRPVPGIPAKFRNRRDFDENGIKWGTHDADALRRADEITVEELQFMEMTVDLATDWANWYLDETELNPENPSARGRVVLMQKCAEMLRGAS